MPLKGRWLGAALATALAVSWPCAADQVIQPLRLRTSVELLGFLGLELMVTSLTPPPEFDPPGNVHLVDKLTLKAWSYDASAFHTNFLAHPLGGTFYYTTARSNFSTPLESLTFATLASLTWELIEYPENVSFNDMIVTPVAGAAIGEPLVQLSRWLEKGPGSGGRRFLSAALFPMKLVNHSPPPDDDEGALDAQVRLITGAASRTGGQLGAQIGTRLIHFPGYGEPGDGGRFAFAGNLTGLSFEARGGHTGVSDVRFATGTSLASYYLRDLDAIADGWDLLGAVQIGYQIRRHQWGDGPADEWSSVRLPGLGLELRKLAGPLRVSLRAELAFTFGGTSSFALDGTPDAVPLDATTTTQSAWGYTMGFGFVAAPSLRIDYGPLTLDFGASLETRNGANGSDPWPDRNPSARIYDRWATVHGGAVLRLPWKDVQLSASLERNLRSGTAGAAERTVGENTALFGVGFGLR